MLNLSDSIRYLKGVGPKKEKKFKELGLLTIKDLLYFYPRSYDDRSNIKLLSTAIEGEKASFIVKFNTIIEDRKIRKNLTLTTYIVEDSSALAKISFFNNKYIKSQIDFNKLYLVSGKVKKFRGQVQLSSPNFEIYNHKKNESRIYPIYPLKKNINNKELINLTEQVLNMKLFSENLPNNLVEKYKLIDKNLAIKNIHRPQNRELFLKARNRLVFEEFLIFELGLLILRNKDMVVKTKSYDIDNRVYKFIENLPFKLTKGQEKVISDIIKDLKSGKRMNRLIQGDVGSGKTIVAIIAMYISYLNGFQSTIMAPTEILAKQHLKNFRELLEPLGVKVELLVGSTSKKNKDRILTGIYNGQIDMLIGTHALIEENVEFKNLGLNVTDEQHRFGVRQREILNTKNEKAHTLVMTATPIPRTLALVVYSDLDVSIIDTLPPNRKKIQTIAINDSMIDRALSFIKEEIKKGRQAYIICPLIEENENLDLDSATEIYEDLKNNYFKDFKLSLLHGKMNGEEKSKIMQDFKDGNSDIIVSTTVIEVGVNVPNSTVIFIYNAERFGLAQLHQLRGRVGRSSHQSYCILYNSSKSKISWERMQVMKESTDGFYIANKDFELRGGGDLFGTRQSGILDLKLADLRRDIDILKYAQLEAKNILKKDPSLSLKEHSNLFETLKDTFEVNITILN